MDSEVVLFFFDKIPEVHSASPKVQTLGGSTSGQWPLPLRHEPLSDVLNTHI
jgi:hypothetical protein